MPSPAPTAKPACHKVLSQDVPRPKKPRGLSATWTVRAADALPKLMAARAQIPPVSPFYVHWSEAIGHMQAVLQGLVTTNKDAKHTVLLAQRAALRALSLMADG